jgi:prepilin-type N-terminal cleavage/methylation domain-containing protein
MNSQLRYHRGFSLVELMVAMTLGVFIMLTVASIFSATLRGNAATLRSARLNQDLSTPLEIMAHDIRRAGFTADQYDYDGTTDIDINGVDIFLPDGNCVLYSYNRDEDAAPPDDNERLGFKLNGGAIEMRNSCTGTTCDTDCTAGNWEDITDPEVVVIDSLTFSTTGSKCYNLETDNYWVTTSDSATLFPCSETNAGNLTTYVYDGSTTPPSYATGGYVAPVSGERLVETRQVNIALVGHHEDDPETTKELDAEVKVRNDRLRVEP